MTTSTNLQTTPYLMQQRKFPTDNLDKLEVELGKSYLEIAQRVNERIIGLFAVNYPVVTGESWYLSGQPRKQQTLRQVYQFTVETPFMTPVNIPHGITLSQIAGFTKGYGVFTDGTNWYGLIFGSNVAIAGQISFYITPSDIIFLVGAGAPLIKNGLIVLEWLSVSATNS